MAGIVYLLILGVTLWLIGLMFLALLISFVVVANLSSAAQAVLHEFWQAPVSPARNVQIAAALRAAADQVVPDVKAFLSPGTASQIRSGILALAAELEGHHD